MKALYTKRIYSNKADIIKYDPNLGAICSEVGYEKRWLFGIKVMDNKWETTYKDSSEEVKPVAGFRK